MSLESKIAEVVNKTKRKIELYIDSRVKEFHLEYKLELIHQYQIMAVDTDDKKWFEELGHERSTVNVEKEKLKEEYLNKLKSEGLE